MIEDHEWSKAEALAIKALWETPHGNTSLKYIVEILGGVNRVPLEPGNPDLTAMNSGRMWVARQLQLAITTPIQDLVKQEADNGSERITRTSTATERRASGGTRRRRTNGANAGTS